MQGARIAAQLVRRQIQIAAALEPYIAAHRRQLDVAGIGIFGHIEELLGIAADIDLCGIGKNQITVGGRHVDTAAKRNGATAEQDAGAGQAQAGAQAVLQMLLCRIAPGRCQHLQCAAGADALRRTVAASQQRRVQAQGDGAGIDAALRGTDDLLAATQGDGIESGKALLACAKDQGAGVEFQCAIAIACRGQIGATVFQRDGVALDGDVTAMAGKRRAVECQRSEACRAEVERLMEIKAGVAAKGQVPGIAQLGQGCGVEHQAAAAAKTDAAGSDRQMGAGQAGGGGKIGFTRGVKQQGAATIEYRTGTDSEQTAPRGIDVLAHHFDGLAIGDAHQCAPVFGRRGQHVILGILRIDHPIVVIVGIAVRVRIDRSLHGLDDEIATAAGAAFGTDDTASINGDLLAGGQDDFRALQFRTGAIAHDDIAGGDIDLRAQQVTFARAAYEQAAGAEIRQACGIDDEVALRLQRAGILPGPHDGDLLAGDIDQAAPSTLVCLRQQAAIERQAIAGIKDDAAAVARQTRRDDVLASQAVLRELESVRRKEMIGKGLVVFGVLAQRAAGHDAPCRCLCILAGAIHIAALALHDEVPLRRGKARRDRAGPCIAGRLDRKSARQQGVTRRQQGVPAGCQAGTTGEPDAVARCYAGNRCGCRLARHHRVHAGHVEDIVGTTWTGNELPGIQIAATANVDHRALGQVDVRCSHADALLGRRRERTGGRIAAIGRPGGILPVLVVGQGAIRHHQPGTGDGGDAAGTECQLIAGDQFDLAKGGAQYPILFNHGRFQAQRASRRQWQGRCGAQALHGNRFAGHDFGIHRRGWIDLSRGDAQRAIDVQHGSAGTGIDRGARGAETQLRRMQCRPGKATNADGPGDAGGAALATDDIDDVGVQRQAARAPCACGRRGNGGGLFESDIRRRQAGMARLPGSMTQRAIDRDARRCGKLHVTQFHRADRGQCEVGKAALGKRCRPQHHERIDRRQGPQIQADVVAEQVQHGIIHAKCRVINGSARPAARRASGSHGKGKPGCRA